MPATASIKSVSENLDDIGNVVAPTPALGEVLKWDGSKWTNQTDNIGAGGATDGDKVDIVVSLGGTSWVVKAGAITLGKMQSRNANTFLGRKTAGSGSPEELTASDAKAILNYGTAANANVAASGDAAAAEVVKGNDTRLSNARAPTAHVHAIGDITDLTNQLSQKSPTSHNHALAGLSDVTMGTPTAGQVLKYNGVAWGPDTDLTGSGGTQPVSGILFAATDRLAGRSSAGGGTGEEIVCTAAGRALLDDANAPAQLTTLGALPVAGGTLTGGVKVRNGAVSGALTSASHSGGCFTTSGNCTIPNEAGFNVTLIAGGAHTVGAGGATVSLASGDMLSIVVPAVGTVKYAKMLAADVGTMAVS